MVITLNSAISNTKHLSVIEPFGRAMVNLMVTKGVFIFGQRFEHVANDNFHCISTNWSLLQFTIINDRTDIKSRLCTISRLELTNLAYA